MLMFIADLCFPSPCTGDAVVKDKVLSSLGSPWSMGEEKTRYSQILMSTSMIREGECGVELKLGPYTPKS